MSSTFTLYKCPSCRSEYVAGTITGFFFKPDSSQFNAYGYCNSCFAGVVGYGEKRKTYSSETTIQSHKGNIADCDAIPNKIKWYPQPQSQQSPDGLPENIASKFLQAEKLFQQSGMEDPSGNAYRAALERALKDLAPDAKGNLYARIKSLVDNGTIIKSMGDFAHSIRVLGNSATHDDEDMTREELTDLRTFTELFLKYTYTLPAMIPDKVKEMK